MTEAPRTLREPDGYAYRYPSYPHGSVIRFETGGSEINGSKPIETIPYFLGVPPEEDFSKPDATPAQSTPNALTIYNAIGFAKHLVGMCVDEEPHLAIRKDLWELINMLYKLAAQRDRQGQPGCCEQAALSEGMLWASWGKSPGGPSWDKFRANRVKELMAAAEAKKPMPKTQGDRQGEKP